MIDFKCTCGGHYQPTKLKNHNLKPYIGLPFVLDEVDGLRCAKCGDETLPGDKINAITNAAAAATISFDERLLMELTVFLRKYLGLTQRELATRMDVSRKAVNEWENKREIAPTYDYVLRGLVYQHLKREVPNLDELLGEELTTALSRVHTAKPKPAQKRTVLPAKYLEFQAA